MKTSACKACGRKVIVVRNHAGQAFALDATMPVFEVSRDQGLVPNAKPAAGAFVDHAAVCRPSKGPAPAGAKKSRRHRNEEPGILTNAEFRAIEREAIGMVQASAERLRRQAEQRQAAVDRLVMTAGKHENTEGWMCQVCNATWTHVHHACRCRDCGATGWFDLMVKDHVCPGTKQRSGNTRPAAEDETW